MMIYWHRLRYAWYYISGRADAHIASHLECEEIDRAHGLR